jgi:hypothetical protein
MKRDDENGIDERSFRFFRDVLAFVETIPAGPKTNKIIEQLVAAAGSIGGNREEPLAGLLTKSSSGSTRSRCAAQTSQFVGCEPAQHKGSARRSSVLRSSTKAASWHASWGRLS